MNKEYRASKRPLNERDILKLRDCFGNLDIGAEFSWFLSRRKEANEQC